MHQHTLPLHAAEVQDAANTEEAAADLWQADWDDEDTSTDFQTKLSQELGRHMKD